MNQAAQVEDIVSSVNESRFLEHLRTLFSTSTTVLAECLQNGRRAGATQIHFAYDDATATLRITDNGCGIADFRNLITVAESGWSEETMTSEKPFGIGFFSVAFAAESIVVESRGRMITFSSEDLIAKRSIAVESSNFIGGTQITLRNCKIERQKIRNALGNYAKGFAVPVFWQGEELERPHALANLTGTTTPIGFVQIPGIHTDDPIAFQGFGSVYCQGLPVAVHGFSKHYVHTEPCPIVHVDHLVYTPRMPDRDCLIDSDKAAKDFSATLNSLWREHIVAMKVQMSAADFVESYWGAARKAGCLDVMADVPVLPRHMVTYVGETPALLRNGDDYMYAAKQHVTLQQVESGEVQLCADFDHTGAGDDFAKLMFARHCDLLLVRHGLPENHWVRPFLRDLANEDVKIGGKVVAKEHFSGGWVEATVKLVENLSVTIKGKTVFLEEPVCLGSAESWSGSAVLMVPLHLAKNGGSAGYVLRQLSTYEDENDHYCQMDYENDSDRLDDLVAILSGEPAVKTVKKCLKQAGARSKTNLRNKTFLVQFDEEGNITVSEAEAQA